MFVTACIRSFFVQCAALKQKKKKKKKKKKKSLVDEDDNNNNKLFLLAFFYSTSWNTSFIVEYMFTFIIGIFLRNPKQK